MRQVRLITGLVMFAYIFSHFFNHALGVISYDAMEAWLWYHMTFWRQHYTLDGAVMRKGEELEKTRLISRGSEVAKWLNLETALPPQGWQQPDFDDSGWLRKPVSNPDSPWMKLQCLRGRFQVEDPQKAADLSLFLRYRGGVAVYLNGKEIGRGHLKAGACSRSPRTLEAIRPVLDAHVHLREPGEEYKETIASGTMAAVAGGERPLTVML